MSTYADAYVSSLHNLVARIAREEALNIQRAAREMADRIAADRLIYVIGPGGHSMIGAEESFYRAGGLAAVSAILDDGFALHHGARRSTAVERTPGYVRGILDVHGLQKGDLLIIVNAYGINAATIESATYCADRGITSVAVTSVELQRELPVDHPARHSGNQNLCDLADIVIDTKVPMGDAVVDMPGVSERVGPVSTVANAVAMNLLVIACAEELVRRGVEPPIWRSGNSPGGYEASIALMEKYQPRIPKL